MKGRKQKKLTVMEDLRQQAEGGQLDIEYDEVETYKENGDRSANFNNAIGMVTRDYWSSSTGRIRIRTQHKLVWPSISSQLHIEDVLEYRASIEHNIGDSL